MEQDKKSKHAFWLRPEIKCKILELYRADNCASQSEFVEKAILFYSGFVASQNTHEYLPVALSSELGNAIQASEGRMARLLFKLAVEMGMMMHIIAETTDLPDSYLTRLRGKCIKEIKKSTGALQLETAVQTHDGLGVE